MIQAGYRQYRQLQVQTGSPGELILLLYNGGIKFLNRAKAAIQNDDVPSAHNNLIRSQDIVLELRLALDKNNSPLAVNLRMIYEFMYQTIVQANLKKDAEKIDQVLALLRELLTAWEQIVRPANPKQADNSSVEDRAKELRKQMGLAGSGVSLGG